MDHLDIIDNLNEFDSCVEQFDEQSHNSKEIWGLKNEIFEAFKLTRFPTREERTEAWSKFQAISAELRRKQDLINAQGERFAEKATSLLQDVSDQLSPGLLKSELNKDEFLKIRETLNEAFRQLRQARWPSKSEKDEAWQRFHELKDSSKEKEDRFYRERKEKFIRRQEHSGELTSKILRALKACDPDSSSDELSDAFGKLCLYLSGIGIIIDLFEVLFGIKDEKEEDPLRQKSAALKDVRKLIQESLGELLKEDKERIFAELDRVKLALDEAWNERREQRDEKKRAWEENQRNFIQMLEEKLERKEGSKEKMERALQNQKDFLPKLENRLSNQKDYLGKVNDQLEDWEDKYNDAWSDSFREKASDIIDNKKDKIREVEQSIEEIETKISEVEDDIRDLESKLDNFDSDLDSLKEKIREAKGRL